MSSILHGLGAEPGMSSAKPALLKATGYFDLIELFQLRDDYGFATDTPDSAPGWLNVGDDRTNSWRRRPGSAKRTRH